MWEREDTPHNSQLWSHYTFWWGRNITFGSHRSCQIFLWSWDPPRSFFSTNVLWNSSGCPRFVHFVFPFLRRLTWIFPTEKAVCTVAERNKKQQLIKGLFLFPQLFSCSLTCNVSLDLISKSWKNRFNPYLGYSDVSNIQKYILWHNRRYDDMNRESEPWNLWF